MKRPLLLFMGMLLDALLKFMKFGKTCGSDVQILIGMGGKITVVAASKFVGAGTSSRTSWRIWVSHRAANHWIVETMMVIIVNRIVGGLLENSKTIINALGERDVREK